MMKRLCVLQGLKPAMLMVVVQIAYVALNVLYKLTISDGMSMRVATAYRLTFSSAFSIPLALIFDRKKRPKITCRVLFMEFLCGFFGGSLSLNLYFAALSLLPVTFMMAISNLSPGITFIMAIPFGLEKLNLGAAAGKAKVIGTITGISGAMLFTFFKGVNVDFWSYHIKLLHPHQNKNGHVPPLHADYGNKLLGVSYAIASCCSYSLWLNIQAKMNHEEYPSHHTGTALMCTMGAIQSTVFALCVDRDWSQWKLGWNIRLLTVAYAGIVASGMVVNIIAWCIHMRGPLFASVFNPLQLVLMAVVASLILNENLYLGSVLGGAVIVGGLYAVLWGKSKEIEEKMQLASLQIIKESEAAQVVVKSPQIDHDKREHDNECQTTTESNVSNDHDHLSENTRAEHNISQQEERR